MDPALHVIMYHYVRDFPNTPFPRIKGLPTSDFHQQLCMLKSRYEMATLESTLEFLNGNYHPSRDLCLLTFDDGLKDHFETVTPILVEQNIQGLFFLITGCMEHSRVASVHMNHMLMAALEFQDYRRLFLTRLEEFAPELEFSPSQHSSAAQKTYRWDTSEVAALKYLINFVLDSSIRDRIIKCIFEEHISGEKEFSQSLYVNWEEAKAMQKVGMVMGGHTHNHRPLSTLTDRELQEDLESCQCLLGGRLHPQRFWPFSYPYGKKNSYSDESKVQTKHQGFTCAFSTEVGNNLPGMDMFALRRLDPKDIPSA